MNVKVELKLDRKMRIIGSTEKGQETIFDAAPKAGGEGTAASPMQVMLQSLGACSFMDTISILRKKRKQVDELNIYIEGERAEEHPKVFTKAHLVYELKSPDSELKDLERAAELSQEKYCGISAMFKNSGCEVTYECKMKD